MKKLSFSKLGRGYLLPLFKISLFLTIFTTAEVVFGQQPLSTKNVLYDWKYSPSDRISTNTLREEPDHIVEVPGATWLRIYFDGVELGSGSYIKLTSLTDGASQILDVDKMRQWSNSSAYFNGNRVKIQVFQPNRSTKVAFSIKSVDAGQPEATTFSQCGSTDDRIPSNDAAIGRIVPIGCTGWIIKNGKMVTAGHCVGSSSQILEFNVPTSNSNGDIVHPDPSDQYTITNVVEGSLDWAVFETLPNSETGLTAIDAQGKSFDVKQVSTAGTIRITGYGVDTGSSNQTQQTHTGPYSSSTSTKLYYNVDTEGGNSGSPVVDENTGYAIGVHTNGGCSPSGGNNSGTNARVAAFWQAMGLDTTDPEPCATTISSFPYSQSFESNIGSWTQYNDDDLDWTRNSGGTASDNTGPSSGADGSSYLYIEASGSNTGYPSKTATIGMPCFNVTSLTKPTLNFAYNMYGAAMGSLTVQTSTDGGATWANAWTISGNQGTDWKYATVNLPSSSGLSIRFRGITGSSWTSDIAIDQVSVKEAGSDPDPDPECDIISFDGITFSSYSNVDAGNYSQIDGTTVLLEDNTWRSIPLNYTITSNTILEFEFRSTSEGEIHGIGFDTDANAQSNRTFKVHGTQNWGISNFDNYSGTSWVSYSIPVGDFYTGSFNRLFFSNDNDAGSGNNSYFRNVSVHEGDCVPSVEARTIARSASKYIPVIGNEGNEDIENFGMQIYPNPVKHRLNIGLQNIEGTWDIKIMSVEGKVFLHRQGTASTGTISADLTDFPSGVYIISLSSDNGKIHQKVIKD